MRNEAAQERAYRKATLAAIAARVREDRPHRARAHPDRASQFSPFTALKGYDDLLRAQEREGEADHAELPDAW